MSAANGYGGIRNVAVPQRLAHTCLCSSGPVLRTHMAHPTIATVLRVRASNRRADSQCSFGRSPACKEVPTDIVDILWARRRDFPALVLISGHEPIHQAL